MNKFLSKLKAHHQSILELDAMQLLYGRTGYMYSFLFINRIIGRHLDINLTQYNYVEFQVCTDEM